MQLSFTHYQERKDTDGKSFLDVECMLFNVRTENDPDKDQYPFIG
ncbi:MAG: hypothetical protein JWP37_3477 [Mucilaginibacter sp.]|nr:hypothetical protein [Mucilaginibacter sp.]